MLLRPLLLLFFASGCAALIYETVWFHLVQLVVAASSISVAVLLCSFMGGLALDSAWLPRLMHGADDRGGAMALLAAIELEELRRVR